MSLHDIDASVRREECDKSKGRKTWAGGKQKCVKCKGTGQIVTRDCACVSGQIPGCIPAQGDHGDKKNVCSEDWIECDDCKATGRVPHEGEPEIEVEPFGITPVVVRRWSWRKNIRYAYQDWMAGWSKGYDTEAEAVAAARAALGKEDQG